MLFVYDLCSLSKLQHFKVVCVLDHLPFNEIKNNLKMLIIEKMLYQKIFSLLLVDSILLVKPSAAS